MRDRRGESGARADRVHAGGKRGAVLHGQSTRHGGRAAGEVLQGAEQPGGHAVLLVVKEAPELKRAGVTVTAVNALTGARECVEHCLVIHTGIAQCADVVTAGESEA